MVISGAIFFSTLGIYASDRLQGIENFASVKKTGICNTGSAPLNIDGNVICADLYEASPSAACPHTTLASILESEQNINTTGCFAVSIKHAIPWNYVSLPQAQRMCAGAGKRLPTSKEWYHLALGTDSSKCSLYEDAVVHTGNEVCMSTVGAFDVIGNVWEWIDATVIDSSFGGRKLPQEGYVTSVDADGVAVTSSELGDELYGKDYFWSKDLGVFGMIRGGFYGSGEDAGLYTLNASVLTSFTSQGVGFRCVEDVL